MSRSAIPVAACLALLCCTAITITSAALADDWTPHSAGLSRSYDAAAPSWSDEFTSATSAGVSLVTTPDPDKWSKIKAQPQFNGEMQTYVDDAAHSAVSGGKLHLAVTRNADNSGFQSAQLSTIGKVSFKYGLFAARIRLPRGQGLWPSLWLFGDSADKYEEISLMELAGGSGGSDGRAASVTWFSKGAGQKAVRAGVPAALSVEPAAFADDFHVFWLEWTPHALTVGLDHEGQVLAGDLVESGAFQSSMHLLLNVAVGGGWTGSQSAADVTAQLPQSMQVDWIRYWAAPELASAGGGIVSPPTPGPTAIPALSGIDLDRVSSTPTSTARPISDENAEDNDALLPGMSSAAAEQSSRLAHVVTLFLLVGAQAVLLSLL